MIWTVTPAKGSWFFSSVTNPVLKQIRDEIRRVDINNLTPIEALNKLNEIKKMIGLK